VRYTKIEINLIDKANTTEKITFHRGSQIDTVSQKVDNFVLYRTWLGIGTYQQSKKLQI
jgi:hypothetical protein